MPVFRSEVGIGSTLSVDVIFNIWHSCVWKWGWHWKQALCWFYIYYLTYLYTKTRLTLETSSVLMIHLLFDIPVYENKADTENKLCVDVTFTSWHTCIRKQGWHWKQALCWCYIYYLTYLHTKTRLTLETSSVLIMMLSYLIFDIPLSENEAATRNNLSVDVVVDFLF